MDLKNLFDSWAQTVGPDYSHKQWLLSKWEMFEGIDWPGEKREILIRTILHSLPLQSSDRLLDLGCGGGWILDVLQPRVRRACGLDVSWEMLRCAQTLLRQIPLLCGEAGRLPFRSESFDKVLCYYVFVNFIDEEYIERSIAEIVRILRPRGRALIGQLPQAGMSEQYDAAKTDYIEYHRRRMELGKETRGLFRPPLKFYRKELLVRCLDGQNIRFHFCDSFNPFYYSGQPERVDWRFDIVLEKK